MSFDVNVINRDLRFEDKNDYTYDDLDLKFFAYSRKIDSLESFILLLFTRKVITVILIKGG